MAGTPNANDEGHAPESVRSNGGTGDEPPHYKVQRIREALAHDRRVGELELGVTVRAGKVQISGTVPSPEVQRAIGEVVREVAPELEPHNYTTVAQLPESGEVERL